jgi:hypothetical protein
MSETDFTRSPSVNTITLEQIDAIVIQRYRGIFGALLVLTEIRIFVSPGPSIF